MDRMISTKDGHVRMLASESEPFYLQCMGRAVRITAIATSVAAANDYLLGHPDEGVIRELVPLVFIARNSDLGERQPLTGTLADEALFFAKRIDDAILPEIGAARAALKRLAGDMGRGMTLRKIARSLMDAL